MGHRIAHTSEKHLPLRPTTSPAQGLRGICLRGPDSLGDITHLQEAIPAWWVRKAQNHESVSIWFSVSDFHGTS